MIFFDQIWVIENIMPYNNNFGTWLLSPCHTWRPKCHFFYMTKDSHWIGIFPGFFVSKKPDFQSEWALTGRKTALHYYQRSAYCNGTLVGPTCSITKSEATQQLPIHAHFAERAFPVKYSRSLCLQMPTKLLVSSGHPLSIKILCQYSKMCQSLSH